MNILTKLRAKLDEHRKFRATVKELQALNDRELSDIGISRYDIHTVARAAL